MQLVIGQDPEYTFNACNCSHEKPPPAAFGGLAAAVYLNVYDIGNV
jgi:hypothetical protein